MKIENGCVVPETEEEKAALAAFADNEKKGVTAKNAELLDEVKKLRPLKDIDPDEYAKLKKQAEDAETERLKNSGEWDKVKQQMVDAHAKETGKLRDENKSLRESLENQVLVAQATQAIADEKGSSLLLMPHVRSRTKLDESGKPVVVDESGNVRVDAQGNPMTVKALIAEMKADVATFGRAFEPVGMTGANTQQGHNSNAQQQPKSSVEKIKAGLEKLNAG